MIESSTWKEKTIVKILIGCLKIESANLKINYKENLKTKRFGLLTHFQHYSALTFALYIQLNKKGK